jgi:hypothetical protein
MPDQVMAYCVKEKAQKAMNDPHEVTLKNGKHALQGICASCGTKMMKFISTKKAAAEPAAQSSIPAVQPNAPAKQDPPHEPGTPTAAV